MLNSKSAMLSECYVIFNKRENVYWWDKFLGEYKHCIAVVKTNGIWVEVATTPTNLIVGAVSIDSYDKYDKIKVTIKHRRNWLTFLSCVGCVKSVIGLKSGWIQTPTQLYKRLSVE